MTNFKTFKPSNMTDLFNAIKDDVSDLFSDWWKANKSGMSGQIKAVAKSAVETQKSLLKGKIPKELAEISMNAQKRALKQILEHTKLMTLALLQDVVDTIFKRIGWGLLNQTGLNVFPDLVKP
jgi:hypothetical protein